jgi:transposase
MARYRTHSIEFKRQVAQEYLSGETLHGLAKRHDIQRQLIRVWVRKYEEGAFDDDAQAADLIQNTRPGSLRWSGSSANRRSNWNS